MRYLIDVLYQEKEVYANYLDLAVNKKQALIANDIEGLAKITEEEKELSRQILALEAARIEHLREHGFKANISIEELLAQIADEYREPLKEGANELKLVLQKCKNFNEQNMNLLQQSSNYINHMIKIFAKTLNHASATYSKTGPNLGTGRIANIQG